MCVLSPPLAHVQTWLRFSLSNKHKVSFWAKNGSAHESGIKQRLPDLEKINGKNGYSGIIVATQFFQQKMMGRVVFIVTFECTAFHFWVFEEPQPQKIQL